MVFNVSEFNIFTLLSGYNDKCEYISNEQVDKDEGEACINDLLVPDQKNILLGTAQFSKKIRGVFVPE